MTTETAQKHPLVIAWDKWLASDEGQQCRAANTLAHNTNHYLENRLWRAFTAGAKASPSDAEQLMELRKTHDSVLRDLKQAAFAYHVEANHKPSAFADCRNGICANACRVFNADVGSNPKQPEKETQSK